MAPTLLLDTIADETVCQTCHCGGEGCDGVVCHGFDAD
jgi:hypothetical protein